MEVYIRALPVVRRVLWAVDINSKIVLVESSLESVFVLSRAVYRIARERKCIEFEAADVFEWWNLFLKVWLDSMWYMGNLSTVDVKLMLMTSKMGWFTCASEAYGDGFTAFLQSFL